MKIEGLSPLSKESAADLDRLCSMLGAESLSPTEMTRILCGYNQSTAGQLCVHSLISMCREAEAIAAMDPNVVTWTKSKALEKNHVDVDALRVLYAYHPSYKICQDPVDTAGALTSYIKHLFYSSIDESLTDDSEATPESFPTRNSLCKRGSFALLRRLSDSVEEEKKMDEMKPKGDAKQAADKFMSWYDDLSDEEEEKKMDEIKPEGNHKVKLTIEKVVINDQKSWYEHLSDETEEEKTMDVVKADGHAELELAVDKLMISHQKSRYDEQELDLEMVASSLLRYQKPLKTASGTMSINPKTLFEGRLSEKIFDPLHVSSSDFVAALDTVCLDHDVLKHHVLTSLSMGLFGGLDGTVTRLVDFMQAYRHFTSTFCTHLEATMKMVGEADPSGHHLEVLEENMEEEQGIYDDEAIEMIESLGLNADLLRNVSHKDLYSQCLEGLRQLNHSEREGLTEDQCRYIAEPLVGAFQAACDPSKGATAATSISAMYLGSELIVATMYSKLSNYLVTLARDDPNCSVTKQHLAFFLLHIDMDVDHADKMREIVVSLANDETTRIQMASAVEKVFTARMDFFDRFVEASFPPTGHSGEDSAKLYNKQSQNWVRKGATCLSDFTGRPVVFEACSPFVEGAHVLDVGCGEGYGARKLVEMGAKRIIGLDVSEEMIQRAKTNPMKSSCESYETCDAEKIVEKLSQMPTALGLVPGRMLEEGCFDLAIAIFLFNYTSINKMKKICKQIYQTLKPGGHFIFSIPHPFMLNAHGSSDSDQSSTFSFAKGDAKVDSYFSLRDRKFAGVIRTLDGRNLNVKMLFKSISDYIDTMGSVGFDIKDIHECRVLPEHVATHPEFFASVSDSPLHIVFDVVKPFECAEVGRIPKAIAWTPFEKANSDRILTIAMPENVLTELVDFSIAVYDRGVTEETFSPTVEDAKCLSNVAAFATKLRSRLVNDTGAVYVTGLNLERFGARTDEIRMIGRSKLAYFILSSLIGKVDGSARGRLFDVRDKGLDTNADNVLFSVSNSSAPHHTDGASADRAYDAVGLLCIQPAADGGKLYLSNAAAALASLKAKLPKFLLNELYRPLPRDILENGKGQGVDRSDLLRFSRHPDLLKLRVRHNAYPIFEEGVSDRDNLLRFRYMRQWIESGHSKAQMRLSPLLKLAMDALDSALDAEKVASIQMKPGDMVFCNNMSFAHSREAFVNKKGDQARHKVRVWIKLQGYE